MLDLFMEELARRGALAHDHVTAPINRGSGPAFLIALSWD